MSSFRDSIPDWVWIAGLLTGAIVMFFKGRAHRRTLVEAAPTPHAGKAEQDALKAQSLGGIGMSALLGGVLAAFVIPEPYGFVLMVVGIAGCWTCVLIIRRAQRT